MSHLSAYLPQDRLRALARGETLPDHTTGAALFADISGFTPLTEALRETLGARRGAEELTKHLDAVYTALIAEVERFGGSVALWRIDTSLEELVAWTHANRYIPELTCEQRALYRLEPLCAENPATPTGVATQRST